MEAVKKLSGDLQQYKAQLDTLDALVKSTTSKMAGDTIIALELALTKVYKLAVLIRGDYDSREDDDVQKPLIFAQNTEGFRAFNAAAATALKQLADIHMKVTALRDNKLDPLRAEIESTQRELQSQKEEFVRQIIQNEQNVITWQSQYAAAQAQFEKAKAQQNDLGFQIARGWGVVIRMITSEREGAERFVRDSLANMTNAQDLMAQSLQRERDTASQKSNLEIRVNEVFQLDQRVILMRSVADAVSQQSSLLMTGFASLMEKSTKLMLLAQEIANRAVVTMKGSYKKSMFAEGLLKLCKLAFVDEQVVDEILMIRNEIVSGYASLEMPNETSKLLGDVDDLLKNASQGQLQ